MISFFVLLLLYAFGYAACVTMILAYGALLNKYAAEEDDKPEGSWVPSALLFSIVWPISILFLMIIIFAEAVIFLFSFFKFGSAASWVYRKVEEFEEWLRSL